MIFAVILLGTDKRVIPCQLLQFLMFPFLGIFTIIPFDQLSGIFLSSRMAVRSGRSSLAASSGSALNNSALRSSCPGAFAFLRDLMAATVSSFIGGSVVLMSRSAPAVSCISVSITDGGLFKTSLKCSDHQASRSASVVRSHACLSVISVSVVARYLPHTILVILYTFPCTHCVAVIFHNHNNLLMYDP